MGYTYGSEISYGDAGVSYSGVEQRQLGQASPNDFFIKLRKSNARPVVLATVKAGLWLRAGNRYFPWGGDTYRTHIPFQIEDVVSVRRNGGRSLTQVFTTGDIANTKGAWFWDPDDTGFGGAVGINPIDADNDPSDAIYVAEVVLRFATINKNLRGFNWAPRIKRAPNLSLRIEPTFGGVGQLGGGKLTLNNGDGFFDNMATSGSGSIPEQLHETGVVDWDKGEVTLELGVDDPQGVGEMTEGDYLQLGVWRVERWRLNEGEFELSLRELKTQFDQQIPFESYSRDQYPELQNDDLGKPIPFAWGKILGVSPTVISRRDRRFKVASHPIKSFDGVRVQQSVTESVDETVDGADWTLDTGSRFVLAEGREIANVNFSGATFDDDLEEVNSPEKVLSTAASWTHQDGLLYVRPPDGETITGGTWTITIRQRLAVWQEVGFETVDLVNAEFTLSLDDWDRSSDVSVDFSGRKMPNGQLMTNGAEIMADLIDYVGEINLSDEVFSAAKKALHVGFDKFGREINVLSPSLYLNERTSALEVASEINSTIGAFLYVGPDGQWRFEVFEPKQGWQTDPFPGLPLRSFDEQTIIDESFIRETDYKDTFAKVQVEYAKRLTEDWAQSLTRQRPLNRFRHGLPASVIEERELGFFAKSDADYLAQRLLVTEGEPLTIYQFTAPWPSFFVMPGDRIRVDYSRFNINSILEVLEVSYDLLSATIQIRAGDQRGFGDSFGFWLPDTAAVTPEMPPGARLWYESDQTEIQPGLRMQFWKDLSGHGQPLTQISPASQPTLEADQINGFPAVSFFGARALDGPNLSALTEAEIFAVLKAGADPAAAAQYGTIWDIGTYPGTGAGQDGGTEYPDTNGDILETFGTNTRRNIGDPVPVLDQWRIYNIISTPSEYTVNLDGSQIFTTATNTVDFPSAFRIGRNLENWGRFNGWFAAIIIFPRKLTATERSSVIQRFSDKYAMGLVAAGGPPPPWPNDSSWTAEEVRLARQNGGYWLKDNNKASDNDERSFLPSRWW